MLRHVGGGPAQHLAQDEHGPLPGRQNCMAAAKASRNDPRESSTPAGSPSIVSGIGWSHGTSSPRIKG
ncbi:hypothetical protein [Nonomuraea sp. CA-141351]|uniref:hypothetical protein n=1 Tax=Nonomuraea sp. CA-141351 TaxID=3239996 RepID=UPI003D93AE11